MPRRKWHKKHRNVQIGDICLLKFSGKMTKASYRLCVIREVEVDENGLVRTCTIATRPRDSREKSLPYLSKKLLEMRVPIQRLVVVCPHDQIVEAEEFSLVDVAHANVESLSDIKQEKL